MKEEKLYDVVVIRDKKISFLERAVNKDDAHNAYQSWAGVYTSDVYFEPVPQLKVIPHRSED
jgi:hypothetical protein